MLNRLLSAVMRLSCRRPLIVGATVLVLAVAGGVLALRMQPTAETRTLVGSSTPGYQATEDLGRRFGSDAVYVFIREPVTDLVLTDDLGKAAALEGCLAGNVQGADAPGGARGPCSQMARKRWARVVFGPGTFITEAANQVTGQIRLLTEQTTREAAASGRKAYREAIARGESPEAAEAARARAIETANQELAGLLVPLALRYGLTSVPRLDDPRFIARLVFDSRQPAGTPKARFAALFPGRDGALIQVRLRSGLSEEQRREAISDIRAAVSMPEWKLRSGGYEVTGVPVLIEELTDSISRSILVLLIAAALVMAITLGIVFRSRLRLVPLLVALAATGLTFGVLAVSGLSLTMASIAVIPILIGLAVDYAIQLQSRTEEGGEPLPEAIERVSRRGAPTIIAAATATAAGFLVLTLSPMPMVRGFGILLVIGIVLAVVCALTLGVAAQALAAGRTAPAPVLAAGRAWREAGEIIAGLAPSRWVAKRAGRLGRQTLDLGLRHPGRFVAVALALAVVGWAAETQLRVESDIQRLVPSSLPALGGLEKLQETSGVGGEVNVLVEAPDISDPAVVAWMTEYQQRVLQKAGYDPARGCRGAELCPAFSLPDLFTSPETLSSATRVDALLEAIPPYLRQNVISQDRKAATLGFGLRLMGLDRQYEVLQEMEAELDPPPGVRARLAGLPVLTAAANDELASPERRVINIVGGLLAVALVLLVAFRSARRALVPLVPIVLATGWSALILFVTRIDLNPLSVVLGTLVIAIATEFSVLLSERYRQERSDGSGVEEALRRTYRSTGAAVLASGVTAIAGFAVLILSDIRMLRDFGLVTVIDLGVALFGVLIVLPAVLVLAEPGALKERISSWRGVTEP